jgi:hypothetical protein
MYFPAALFFTLLGSLLPWTVEAVGADSCLCGFRDNVGNLFTDCIIVYFNETDSAPDFLEEDYVHAAEKGWNSKFRQGATPQNVELQNVTGQGASLELFISPPTKDHLVLGGAIRSRRQDILFGSFQALLRSPQPWAGGSALTMTVDYNETQAIDVNLMNTDNATTAWLSTLLNGEFPNTSLGVPYADILNASRANRSIPSPWDFNEVRILWSPDEVNYYFSGNLTRSVPNARDNLVVSPASFALQHWSTGDTYSMQGPPATRASVQVGWIRLFFNSSLTTPRQRLAYDAQCRPENACSVDDTALRGSSPYAPEALLPWHEPGNERSRSLAMMIVSAFSSGMIVLLLLHVCVRAKPWKRRMPGTAVISSSFPRAIDGQFPGPYSSEQQSNLASSSQSISPQYTSSALDKRLASTETVLSPLENEGISASLRPVRRSLKSSLTSDSTRCSSAAPEAPLSILEKEDGGKATKDPATHEDGDMKTSSKGDSVVEASAVPFPQRSNRIDYLAGMVAIGTLLVTFMHFCLTFLPAAVEPGGYPHFSSDIWAFKIIAPVLLNYNWVGPFFTTSSRFLAASYLQNGGLHRIAEKAVRRTPRMMIPAAAIALITYFVIDSGATAKLEYLPSITWSDWPYTQPYNNFADYVSEILELAYLVPNAAPKITWNFCTGVLWTIPVQLQGSWLVLLGVVLIKEITTPWKRFSYYALCISLHWYARSWGSFLWTGLLLADLDVTYRYKDYLSSRQWLRIVTVASFFCVGFLGILADLIPGWIDYSFSLYENNIHPDVSTGLPLGKTSSAGYPPYYVPRLSGLFFAVGVQGVVETSTTVQWFLSFKVFLALFPHNFTIFLIHGMFLWTWGAWLCVLLVTHGIPYWAVMLIVWVTSYALIGLSLPLFTPAVEGLGRAVTRWIWRLATTEQPKRGPTLYPFHHNVFLGYENITESV